MARFLLSALSARRGGGQTYLRHIVRSFPADAGHSLTIVSARPIAGLPQVPGVEWTAAPGWSERPIGRFLFGAIYFRWFWPRRDDFDLVYFAGGSFDMNLPPRIRRAVAFRNMLPFDLVEGRRYPLGWTRFRHWLLRYVQAHAFRRADLVVFISNHARDVIDRLVRRRGAAIVVPHGVAPTQDELAPALAAKLPERFVLYLSQLDVYKAQVELVAAWAAVRRRRDTPEKLVLAGPRHPYYTAKVQAAIKAYGLDDEVVMLGEILHGQVFDLARRATLNLFLSSCENCPNIMLELMRVGRPMLVSDRQPMPELGGPDLDYVNPYDPPAIARAIERLLDDAAHGQRVAAAALRQSFAYDWDKTGSATWGALIRAAEARRFDRDSGASIG